MAALVLALVLLLSPAAAVAQQVTFASTVSIAPTWFDPAETPGVITPSYGFTTAIP